MANTVQLKKNGQIVYPITDRSCIIGLEEGPVMSCRYAWDGTTTPDVTKIPTGVTVEYNSNTYTGTLAASASTVGYQYLVYNPTSTEFDRYATDATGGSYAWKPMGDTTIQSPDIADNLITSDSTKALSAKQGKVLDGKVSQLQKKVDGLPGVVFDLSDYPLQDGLVVGNLTAFNVYDFHKHIVIPVSDYKGRDISITSSETANVQMLFLSGPLVNGQAPPVCSGTGWNTTPEHTTKTYTIPEDCTQIYIYIKDTRTTIDHTPDDVEIVQVERLFYTKTETDAVINPLKDGEKELNLAVFGGERVDINASIYPVQKGIIAGGIYYDTGDYYNNHRYCLIPLSEYKGRTIRLVAQSNHTIELAFLNDALVGGQSAPYCQGTGYITISAGQTADYVVPDDCINLWLYIGGTRSSYPYYPAAIYIKAEESDLVTKSELSAGLVTKVNKSQGTENYGKHLVVGPDGNVTLGDGAAPITNTVAEKQTKELYLSADIINNPQVILGAGWTGTLQNGFTHTSGNTDAIEIQQATISGEKYLVECELSQPSEASIFLSIGDGPLADVYNGTTTIKMGFVSDGGYLKITPVSSYSGTVSNIHIKKLVSEGEENETITVQVYNIENGTMADNITGFWNVVLGTINTMQHNQNGSRNIVAGYAAMGNFKSGTRNVMLGTFAGANFESGDHNISIGADSFYFVKKGNDNISIGYAAIGRMQYSELNKNIAIGTQALGYSTSDASENVAIGELSCYYSGKHNVGVGVRALYWNRGMNNVAVGYSAQSGVYRTGDQNVAIGCYANCGSQGTASEPTIINNAIAIGYQAFASKSNQVVIGNANHTEFVLGTKKLIFNQDGTVSWETID